MQASDLERTDMHSSHRWRNMVSGPLPDSSCNARGKADKAEQEHGGRHNQPQMFSAYEWVCGGWATGSSETTLPRARLSGLTV